MTLPNVGMNPEAELERIKNLPKEELEALFRMTNTPSNIQEKMLKELAADKIGGITNE